MQKVVIGTPRKDGEKKNYKNLNKPEVGDTPMILSE